MLSRLFKFAVHGQSFCCPQGTFAPAMSFTTLKQRLEKRQHKQSEDEFKKEMDFLANKPSFTLVDFKQRIIDGLAKLQKGLRYKFMTGNEQTEVNLMTQRKVLNAMLDEELLDEKKLKSEQKTQISMITQVPVQDINMMLKNFDYMKTLHKWVREIKERGEPLPNNQEEMLYRFKKDRPFSKNYIKMHMNKPKYSMYQMRQRIKWGPRKTL
jgi:signal recognition particle GTPase